MQAQTTAPTIAINLYGDTLLAPFDSSFSVPFNQLSDSTIGAFYQKAEHSNYQPLLDFLLAYKKQTALSDWLYYQLIRKTAEAISPKAANYHRYTLYKWFLLAKSGYDATLRVIDQDRLLFYVRSDENVYNIPYQTSNGQQYVCLNYHDYGNIDFEKIRGYQNSIHVPGAAGAFSYRITQMPFFKNTVYVEKNLDFNYQNKDYHLKIRLNPMVKDILANYPVVDFESCFNIPLCQETYASLITSLKESVKGLDQKSGIDYLMHFTRYAFPFEKDKENFGGEKRLSPEETLLYDHSDCEDRAALLFYLVKEIYNLPMVTLLYPEHVTIAIQFPGEQKGKTIAYKGRNYTVCEPTPQAEDLKMGQLPHSLRKKPFDVGYEYNPSEK
jgi:hypothetical protein